MALSTMVIGLPMNAILIILPDLIFFMCISLVFSRLNNTLYSFP